MAKAYGYTRASTGKQSLTFDVHLSVSAQNRPVIGA